MRLRVPEAGDLLETFVVANLGFLGVDIAVAHATNRFAVRMEWAPLAFSAVVTVLLLPGLFRRDVRRSMRAIALGCGAASIALGVAGMLFHLRSGFFDRETLHALVYSAPFIAPLSYVGVGLLLVLSRMEPAGSAEWSVWVVLLALGGFAGNLGLSLLDHAQNGFFSPLEWIPVAGAAFAVAFLGVALLRREDRILLRACVGVLVFEAMLGALGAALHVQADLRSAAPLAERILFGAPVFAPLLFCNLALLAWIGLREFPGQRAAAPGADRMDTALRAG